MPEPAPIPNDTPHIADLLSRYDNAASRNEELAVPAEIERRIAGLEAQLAAAREDERQACLLVVEDFAVPIGVEGSELRRRLAAEIRRRAALDAARKGEGR